MPSHLSSIGFALRSKEEFLALANEVAAESEAIEVPGGYYLCWTSSSGAQLWLQVDEENDLVGLNPHFFGESRLRVGLTYRIERPGGSQFDGAFNAWADPHGDEPASGIYPFVFDAPDFQCHSGLQLPSIAEAQIVAFAHELSVFRSEAEYLASQPEDCKFASRSFIPSGLFGPDVDAVNPPEAHGIFTGHILDVEMRTNELSNRPFQWILVDTLGGQFDVVADPELVEVQPIPGGLLHGSFWLSGRVLH